MGWQEWLARRGTLPLPNRHQTQIMSLQRIPGQVIPYRGGLAVQKRPGGPLAARPLHLFWVADCSGSMSGGKIASLNNCIRENVAQMQAVAAGNPYAQVFVRTLRFSDGAQWQDAQPVRLEMFQWKDLTAAGKTAMGEALETLAEQLKMPPMPSRGLPPMVVLVSDGKPTDDFEAGVEALLATPWGKRANRQAIAIGDDADDTVLKRFIYNPEYPPLRADNPEALARCIRWVSIDLLRSASSPGSQAPGSAAGGNVPIPAAPAANVEPVW